LAGIQPTARGYTIDPHLPSLRYSLRLPDAGVAYSRTRALGYLVLERKATIHMSVRPPTGVPARLAATWVDGRRVRHSRRGRLVTFRLRGRAGRAVDWAVTRR
jgi:hypothetical protein